MIVFSQLVVLLTLFLAPFSDIQQWNFMPVWKSSQKSSDRPQGNRYKIKHLTVIFRPTLHHTVATIFHGFKASHVKNWRSFIRIHSNNLGNATKEKWWKSVQRVQESRSVRKQKLSYCGRGIVLSNRTLEANMSETDICKGWINWCSTKVESVQVNILLFPTKKKVNPCGKERDGEKHSLS